jgi:hypothetical protein
MIPHNSNEVRLRFGRVRNLLTGSTFFSDGGLPAERLFEGLPALALRNSG